VALASECSGCKGSATEYDLAPLTSRKLRRFFKAFAFLSLLATAGVGAGVAYRLGERITLTCVLPLCSRGHARRPRCGDANVPGAVRCVCRAAAHQPAGQPEQPGARARMALAGASLGKRLQHRSTN
jgi:hypothetical protein